MRLIFVILYHGLVRRTKVHGECLILHTDYILKNGIKGNYHHTCHIFFLRKQKFLCLITFLLIIFASYGGRSAFFFTCAYRYSSTLFICIIYHVKKVQKSIVNPYYISWCLLCIIIVDAFLTSLTFFPQVIQHVNTYCSCNFSNPCFD